MSPVRTPKYPYLKNRDFTSELVFSATRSSGPGGQHVNKVSTRVELRFHVTASNLLADSEKLKILRKLKSILTKEGELILVSQSERTQLRNKENVVEKFHAVLNKTLTVRKKRVPTKATVASEKQRLERKKMHSKKKSLRKKISDN